MSASWENILLPVLLVTVSALALTGSVGAQYYGDPVHTYACYTDQFGNVFGCYWSTASNYPYPYQGYCGYAQCYSTLTQSTTTTETETLNQYFTQTQISVLAFTFTQVSLSLVATTITQGFTDSTVGQSSLGMIVALIGICAVLGFILLQKPKVNSPSNTAQPNPIANMKVAKYCGLCGKRIIHRRRTGD